MSEYTLHHGRCEDVLPTFPENHFDSVVCDPPYGIRFMGKAWDGGDIDKAVKTRLRKNTERPDGTAFAAGAYNQSNQNFQSWITTVTSQVYRVLKPGGYLVMFGSPRTFHRLVSGIEDAGFEIRDTLMWIFSSGFPKSHNLSGEYDGWGSALKPAYEPICMARKPLDGTITENMARWGTGALDIDASRVPGDPWFYGAQPKLNGGAFIPGTDTDGVHARNVSGGHEGRWPANIMHDGSAEVLAAFPEAEGQMGDVKGTEKSKPGHANTYSKFNGDRVPHIKRDDNGSAARFFAKFEFTAQDERDFVELQRLLYCAKTSRSDRNEGCEQLKKMPLLWSSGTENPGSFQSDGTDRSSANNHPTVKPTELMRYLNRMVTRPGGRILDFMCGSGSTLKAGLIDGYDCVGIDQEAHYIDIARARCEFVINNRDLFGKFIRPKK